MPANVVYLDLDARDPLLDLKLAIWETELTDVYPTACVNAEFDQSQQTVRIAIEFANASDQLHWQLSWTVPNTLSNHWLAPVHHS